MTPAPNLAARLEDASERIAVLERRRQRVIAERDELLTQALDAGMTKADVARACRMSRARVNQILLRPSVQARVALAQGRDPSTEPNLEEAR
jgi:hypothetical protein